MYIVQNTVYVLMNNKTCDALDREKEAFYGKQHGKEIHTSIMRNSHINFKC